MDYSDRTTGATEAEFVFSGTADASAVVQCRNEFSRWLQSSFALDAMQRNDVVLAANEALTNSAEFAYLGAEKPGTMTMRATFRSADRRLSVVITDRGMWRVPAPSTAPNTRGRGIQLMRALADRMTISRRPSGTVVELEFDDFTFAPEEPYASTA
jgi:serine/threonine-protein kinase RsbW